LKKVIYCGLFIICNLTFDDNALVKKSLAGILEEARVHRWVAVATDNLTAFHALLTLRFKLGIGGGKFVTALGASASLGQPSNGAVDVVDVSTRQACDNNTVHQTLTANSASSIVVSKFLAIHGENARSWKPHHGSVGSWRSIIAVGTIRDAGADWALSVRNDLSQLGNGLLQVVGALLEDVRHVAGVVSVSVGRLQAAFADVAGSATAATTAFRSLFTATSGRGASATIGGSRRDQGSRALGRSGVFDESKVGEESSSARFVGGGMSWCLLAGALAVVAVAIEERRDARSHVDIFEMTCSDSSNENYEKFETATKRWCLQAESQAHNAMLLHNKRRDPTVERSPWGRGSFQFY